MHRADAIFGSNEVEFTRVVDSAGALTHRERMELLRYLEDLERKLHPIALGVYITDHGQMADFRHHAHWILNHAHIHHPSYGKREQRRAAEDAPLVELRPGEFRQRELDKRPSILQRGACFVRDLFLPYPKPVEQEWMLILVLDVQLELACFSWGYMLDPYINPDKITTCIVKARLLFRERAMVMALKRVMALAVRQIAVSSRRTNKQLRHAAAHGARVFPQLLAAAGVSAMVALPAADAQQAVSPDIFADDDVAEVVEVPAAATPNAPAPQPVTSHHYERGAAASYQQAPRWTSRDEERLMQARIGDCYNLLLPAVAEAPVAAPRPAATDSVGAEVSGRYTELYKPLSGRGVPPLNDPQRLLTDMESEAANYVLSTINAHRPYRICVTVFGQGQNVPAVLRASVLVDFVTTKDEYAILLQYDTGDSPTVTLAARSMGLTAEQMADIEAAVQAAALAAGGGADGLIAAMRALESQITPLQASFPPIVAGPGETLSAVQIEGMDEEPEEPEVSTREKLMQMFTDGTLLSVLWTILAGVVLLVIGGVLYYWRRGFGKLLDTRPDIRLNSRYGAGVSRYVRYLEGMEDTKVKNLF